uniref:Uncharacterized protein n=1 Tax=Anguilla anguilla TaxID=7936 RepID=A0A0E9W1T8_ANGAN
MAFKGGIVLLYDSFPFRSCAEVAQTCNILYMRRDAIFKKCIHLFSTTTSAAPCPRN